MNDLPPPSSTTPVSTAPPAAVQSGGVFHNVMYVAIGLIAFVLLVVGGLQLTRGIDDNDGFAAIDTTTTTVAPAAADLEPLETVPVAVATTSAVLTAESPVDSSAPATTMPTVEPTVAPSTLAETAPETSVADQTSTSVVETTGSDAADADPAESSTEATSAPDVDVGYPTLPDGRPVPIETVYDGATVTLTGLVPSQAASDRLEALAVAGAPDPDTVAVNLLEINALVPNTVAARVLSLDSVRFPEGSAEITAEHAAELDGTVRTMEALPNTTLLVIGHADQRGDDLSNLVLSDERADAMVLYFVSRGIDPSRLSSRGVGENDPISTQNDDAALQLNRRTELVFSGLLVD